MLTGFLLAVFTGLTWCAIGMVLSRCARDHFDAVAYSLIQGAGSAVFTFLCYVNTAEFELRTAWPLILLIVGAGVVNGSSQAFVKRAMSRGHHGPVWAISQSALVLPFLFSCFVFGERGTVFQWGGTVLIAAGILIPVAGEFRRAREWFLPAFLSFLMFGLCQVLYLFPSREAVFADPAHLRPTLVCLGNLTGWSLVGICRGTRPEFSRAVTLTGIGMALLSVLSLKAFFESLDILTRCGLGGIGIPVVVGSNIAFFALYALVILREKNKPRDWAGLAAVLAGIVCIAL